MQFELIPFVGQNSQIANNGMGSRLATLLPQPSNGRKSQVSSGKEPDAEKAAEKNSGHLCLEPSVLFQ
jgi:hypothetical protein